MENLLKKLKHIQPTADFKERSKTLILSHPQNPETRFLFFPQYSLVIGGAMIILLAAIGLNLNKQSQSAKLASLDPEKLAEEISELDIQIQLSQVKYYEDSINKIEVALNETSGKSNN